MKQKLTSIIFAALLLFFCITARADVKIGGYNMSGITSETISILAAKNVIPQQDAAAMKDRLGKTASAEAMAAAPLLVSIYNDIGKLMVKNGAASNEEIESLYKTASSTGGLKSGGVNPVVLAAAYLDLMAKKGITNITTAQGILDGARE